MILQRVSGRAILVVATMAVFGCASVPPPPPPAPAVTFEQKMSWIVRLEDQRILYEPDAATTAPVAPVDPRMQPPPPPPVPNLLRLLVDPEARIRRRAALGVGRVRLTEGIAPLRATLAGDPEPEVRQMAAFGLGLIGDRAAIPALSTALADASPLVRGRAAEAIGLIGDPSAASAIGEMVSAIVATGAPAQVDPDNLGHPLDPSVEAFRLGIYALARLKAFEPLARAVLDAQGQLRVRWWPVASALQRTEDRRAFSALADFARLGGFGASFGARGLGALKDPAALPVLVSLVQNPKTDARTTVSAIRALAQLGDPRAIGPLAAVARRPGLSPDLVAEAVTALAAFDADDGMELLLDLQSHRVPAVRAAALRALARADAETFLAVLSGMDPDPHWSVRATLAEALAGIDQRVSVPRLQLMLTDSDQRVLPAVLAGLTKFRAPGVEAVLRAHLAGADPVVRMSAAANLAELNTTAAAPALSAAYEAGLGDNTYVARAAALAGLAKAGPAGVSTLKAALRDKEWAVRVRAAELLAEVQPGEDWSTAIRPAPTTRSPDSYGASLLVNPTVSPHVFLDTTRGTVQIELAVLDAPLTSEMFIALVRRGFYDGLPWHRVVPNFVAQGGDPRGDGEGGPGYTIRDELNQQPYLRGTVGMALDWRDTGGSQFFITHSPQPHLDARYTVFGRVVAGMEAVDQLQQWDVIERARVWD
jgi:cyclophilin family peptidyl-prolyl cis-trans isomerase/HEAT repeat protein